MDWLVGRLPPALAAHPVRSFISLLAALLTIVVGLVAVDQWLGHAWTGAAVVILVLLVGWLRETLLRQQVTAQLAQANQSPAAAPVQALRDAVTDLDRRVHTYRKTLKALTEHHQMQTPFSEVMRVTYVIGADGRGDCVQREHETQSLSADAPLLWRTFDEMATGARARHITFEEAGITPWAQTGDVDLIALVEDQVRIEGLMIFSPAIGPDVVHWGMRYEFPQMWDDLRRTGRDDSWFTPHASVSRLEMRWEFPVGAQAPHFTAAPRDGTTSQSEVNGRWVLGCTIVNPPYRRLYFGLAMRPLV